MSTLHRGSTVILNITACNMAAKFACVTSLLNKLHDKKSIMFGRNRTTNNNARKTTYKDIYSLTLQSSTQGECLRY